MARHVAGARTGRKGGAGWSGWRRSLRGVHQLRATTPVRAAWERADALSLRGSRIGTEPGLANRALGGSLSPGHAAAGADTARGGGQARRRPADARTAPPRRRFPRGVAAVAARVRRLAQQCPLLGAHANAPAGPVALRGPTQHGVLDRIAGAIPGSSARRAGVRLARRGQALSRLVEVRHAARPGWALAKVHRVATRQEGFPNAAWPLAAG